MEPILAYMPALRAAVDEAARSGEWIVIVVPDKDPWPLVRVLHGVVPEESRSAGRTVMLPDHGRVSLVSLYDDEFDGHGCRAVLVGCEDLTAPGDIIAVHRWTGARPVADGRAGLAEIVLHQTGVDPRAQRRHR